MGSRRCTAHLAEVKSLGLKTFLLPLNPGKGVDGEIIDYGGTAFSPVWDEIEAAGLPISHHIGETRRRRRARSTASSSA